MLGIATFCAFFVVLGIGTWRRPAVAFVAVLCLYGLKQWGQDTSPFLVEHRTIANFMVAILAGIGLVRMALGPNTIGMGSPGLPWKLGAALYVYALATLMWTPDLQAALAQWSADGPYIALVAFAAPFLLRRSEDMPQICDWLVIAGGGLCVLALFYGHWGERGLLLESNQFDEETNPLAIASLAGTVTIVSMLSIQRGAWWKKLLNAAMVPIALAVIVRSGSRGQLLATGAAVLIGWPLVSSRRNLGAWLMLAGAAGVLYVVGSLVWQHVDLNVDTGRWSGAQSTEDVQGRLAMATTLVHQATSGAGSLIFGLGNSSSFHYLGFYPHVTPAEILGEEGLIGMSVYVALLIAVCLSIWRLRAAIGESPGDTARLAYGVLTALFLFEFILTMKQGGLLSSTYVFAYGAILGRMAQWSSRTTVVRLPDTLTATRTFDQPFPNLMR